MSKDHIRSHLKKRFLAQGQSGTEFQPAPSVGRDLRQAYFKYVEDLKQRLNTETCPPPADWDKRFF
jgi:hypothetical protein